MKSVGTRRRSATPIQKRENRRAVMKERTSVPRAKARNIATGVEESRNWIRTKVYDKLAFCPRGIFKMRREGEYGSIRKVLAGPAQMLQFCCNTPCEYLG